MLGIFTSPDVEEIKPSELQEKITNDEKLLLLDLRSGSEFSREKIDPGSGQIMNYSSRELTGEVPEKVKEKPSERDVIVVCYKGNISEKVASKLDEKLEHDVKSLKKGMSGWRKV